MKRLSSSVVYICIQFQNRKTNKEMFVPAMGGNPRKKKKKKKKPINKPASIKIKLLCKV
jgi:hypothetical protein